MKLALTILIFGLFLTSSCSPCKNLQTKDLKIQDQFEALQAKETDTETLRYRTKLQALYLKEQNLLNQVRSCTIEDPISYNYWYGQRLKYPSKLETTWLQYRRDRKGSQ